MNTDTKEDCKQLLERVFGDDMVDVVRERVENRQRRAVDKMLAGAGIDADALVERALRRIELPEGSDDSATTSPIQIYDLTDEEFEQLDEEESDAYLEAHGVDVSVMLERAEELVQEPVPVINQPEPTGSQLDLAEFDESSSNINISSAHTVLHDVEQIQEKKTFTPFRPALAATLLLGALIGTGGTATYLSMVDGEVGFRSESLQLAANLPSSIEDSQSSSSITDTTLAMTAGSSVISMESGEISGEISSETNLQLASTAVESVMLDVMSEAPAEAALQVLLDEEETERMISRTLSSVDSKAMQTVALSSEPRSGSTGLISTTNATDKAEFTFEKGDTLSHGMMKQGLPLELQSKIADKLQVVFRPGDRAVFYFLENEFDRLELILEQGKMITINRNLNMEIQEVGEPEILLVSGEIKGSLNTSFVQALDANAAWRIEQLLKRERVPFTTLPKGTTFEVEIEKMVIPGSAVVRYGSVRYIHIDTGHGRQYTVGSKAEQAYLTPFSPEFWLS